MTKTEQITYLQKRLAQVEAENQLLHDSVSYLRDQLYGRRSEKTSSLAMTGQVSLFDEVEYFSDEEPVQTTIEETRTGEKRKKQPGQRKQMLRELPHEKRLLSLPEEKRCCKSCESGLHRAGEEFVRSEVEYIPASLKVIDYYRETFECRRCRAAEQPYMHPAPVPPAVIRNSSASPSLATRVMQQKYQTALPLYRQEGEWETLGLPLSRSTMANWILVSYRDWLSPVVRLLHERLLLQTYLHADETTLQVLGEDGRKNTTSSYMWVYSSGKHEKEQIRLLDYQPGRGAKYPRDFLSGFSGYLHTDAYAGYESVEGVTRCLCWAHLRRYFAEALPKSSKGTGSSTAARGIRLINRLFSMERSFESLSAEERKKRRLEKQTPVLEEFWSWVEKTAPAVLPKSRLAAAFAYAQNHKEGFLAYLQDGNCVLSNNQAENSIRPFTVGRKNWLFSGSPRGAQASAGVYTLFETAKANGLDPAGYIQFLLERLPLHEGALDSELLQNFLPWNSNVQQFCRS